MVYRMAVRTVLFFFCMSWLPGTNNISLAQTYDRDDDLYSREAREDETLKVVNRPPNIQGLTGLITTNSAFTRPAGSIAIGVAALGEDSRVPNYSIIQVPVTLTIGITDTIEAGLKAKYVNFAKSLESGMGDSEVALKWRWNTHSTTSPELAIGVAGIIPTADETTGLNEVTDWGAKFMVMATSETKIFKNSFLGIYLEAQAVFIDGFSAGSTTNATNTQDRYGVLNAGILLPISPNNQLQVMLEVNDTFKKSRKNVILGEGDQLGVMPGLRFVTDSLNITAGAQFLRKDAAGFEDTIRWVGTMSYQF
jgi:hypothetical protein